VRTDPVGLNAAALAAGSGRNLYLEKGLQCLRKAGSKTAKEVEDEAFPFVGN
jgi:hypothetical protein